MTDSYPEYLNPFAEDTKPKTKLSISNSFKGLKRTLRQSFRIKKKNDEEVIVRQKSDTLRRFPMSYPNPSHEALPRSRFRERLSKHEPSTSTPGPNPFDEDEENNESKIITTRRRGKKRAPMPPKSLSSQDINDEHLNVPKGSHWSLTSADTDYSGSMDNISGADFEPEAKKEVMLEKFMDFNKEMEKLKDDSNNNIITKEEISKERGSNNNVPDLVISCPSDSDSNKLKLNEDPPQDHSEIDDKNDENNSEINNKNDESNSEINNKNDDNNSDISESDSKELVITDITNNMIAEESDKINDGKNNEVQNKVAEGEVQNNDEELFLYHEKASLYIAGSRDELNESDTYTGRISLYITGSTDALDACNNNDKNGVDENYNDSAPIPKQRKNKLSKNSLLGM